MASPVCIYGNPALRKKSEPVKAVSEEILELADYMLRVMYAKEGIGLAAEQIGRTEAVFVLDVPFDADKNDMGLPNNPGVTMPQVIINPEIIGTSDEMKAADEGCLSFPDLYVSVARPAEVVLRFLDRGGNVQVMKAKGLLARAIQHEFDHLNGILLYDHMSPAARLKNALRLKMLKKKSRESA
ncbi:MAG: peptide deformylase [Pontiellaceae bacterium]|jgi:peptide deformylase|nr:peptide deformylase [Pontiellaceae bacterium]